jgi:RHS repeat-associated protein
MKLYLILSFFLFMVMVSAAFSQTTENFVKTYRARTATTSVDSVTAGTANQSYKTFTYYDGLGRSKQTIDKESTITGKDLITPIGYDGFGRTEKEYLPYFETSGIQDGRFRTDALDDHFIRTSPIYGDSHGYTQNLFEPSPLNRVDKQAAPGSSWQMGSGKEVKLQRRTNTVSDDVKIWTVNSAGLPVTVSSYPANTLWAETTYDEDNIQTVQFTDKLGRIILKKVEGCVTPVTDGHSGWLSTYYVYDDLGQLRVVIPSLAIDLFEVNNVWGMSTDSDISFELFFAYSFDDRGRMVSKKVPGRKVEYFLYDLQDRMVASQDGVLRTSQKWLYSRYDRMGRLLATGLVSRDFPIGTLQTEVDAAGPNNASLVNGIPTVGWPSEQGELLTVNYYDSYLSLSGFSYQANTGFAAQASTRIHGLQTGKKVKNLETGSFYTTAKFYDEKGRVVQTLSEHQLGGLIRTSTQYNFENQPTLSLTSSTNTGVEDIRRIYSYNVIGQVASISHKIGSDTSRTIVEYSYNDLGQLEEKFFPEITSGNQTYSYNIRGWLKDLGSELPNGFTQVNYYQEAEAVTPRYNGNISRIDWGGKEGIGEDYKTRTYNYIYDNAHRLKTANFDATGELNRFTVDSIKHDANGNIYTMKRSNQRAPSEYGVVDDLEYSYYKFGNRLSQVKDNNTSLTYTAKDFKDRETTEYGYDDNGNMTGNPDKQISLITYNYLNLPQEITFTTGAKLKFAYDADGNKLTQKVYNSSGTLTKTQDYIGEIVLLDGALDYLIHEEGRIVAEVDGLWGEYYVKDHLGNVRQVLRSSVSQSFIATMETQNAETEEQEFTQITASRQLAPEHNKTVGGNQVAWLNADRGRMVGPGRSQEIYAGDSVILQVYGKYLEDRNQKVNAGSFATQGAKDKLINDLNELAVSTQRAGGANPIALFNLANILAGDLQKKQAPEAYLIYALYDQDSNRYEVGKKVLTRNAANQHEILEEEMYISKDGYMETFVVNETSEDVWFDNLLVMSVSSVIVQETHYDPWGLELTGLGFQYGGIRANKYLYNGKELIEDNGLQYYDYGARMYDPAIGRWGVIDPLSDQMRRHSPYNYAFDNPIRFIDPDGMAPIDIYKENEKGRFDLVEETDHVVDQYIYRDGSSQFYNKQTGVMSEKVNVASAGESGGEGKTSSIISEVLKWIGRANSVAETATDSKATKILGPIITVASISKDAVETDFTDPEQVGNFVENSIQNGVESTPVIGPALGVIMDDAKKDDGVLNTDNLVKSYRQSHNQNMQMYQRILKLNTKQKEK